MSFIGKIKSFVNSHIDGFSFSTWFKAAGVISRTQMLNEYRRYVYTIVSAIAQDTAKLEFIIKKPIANGYKPMPNHPFLELMRRPNPDYSQFEFLEQHETYMGLCGESFWYLVNGETTNVPKQMVLLRPDQMTVAADTSKSNPNPLGFVTGYVLNKPDGTKITFEKDEILHIKTPNPLNPYRGLGPIEAAVDYIMTEKYTSQWTKNSLYNSGRPSGIINFKGVIGKDEFNQLKKKFKTEYSGPNNAGKTLLTKGSDKVDYIKLGMDMGDVALKELKDISRDDIMIMYRVSKTILGITDDVNRASAKEAKSVWMENVIKPKMERIVDAIDSKLIDRFLGDVKCDYRDPSPKYLEDRSKEWSLGHNKWLSTNAIIRERNEFLGTDLKEVEGGDEIYQSVALVPIGSSMDDEPDDEPPKDEPPKDDNKKSIKKKKKEKKAKKKLTLYKKGISREEFGRIFRQELFTYQKQWQLAYKKAVVKILEEQKKEIIEKNTKVFEEWVFDLKKSKASFLEVFLKLGVELFLQQSEVAFHAAGDDETTLLINSRVTNYLNERVERFATEFDSETVKKIKTSIGEGYKNGESIKQLTKRIDNIYTEAEKYRATRVARTETIATSNQAALEAYRQSPMVAAQEWSTEDNGCDFCQAMNGKIIGLDSNYFNVGESLTVVDAEGHEQTFVFDYMDVDHPPLHPNCRCSILPVSVNDYNKILTLKLEKKYKLMDKRTREAKETLKEIRKIKARSKPKNINSKKSKK